MGSHNSKWRGNLLQQRKSIYKLKNTNKIGIYLGIAIVFSIVLLLIHYSQQCAALNNEDIPIGNINYNIINNEQIWYSEPNTTISIINQYDIDLDGNDELIFSTNNNNLVIFNIVENAEILNFHINSEIIALGINNVDTDETPEVIVSTRKELICFDLQMKSISWSKSLENLFRNNILFIRNGTNIQGNEKFDILIICDYYFNYKISRYNDKGDILYSIPILPINTEIGPMISCLVRDTNRDNIDDIIVSDYGESYIAPIGIKGIGRHLWIYNGKNGALITSKTIPNVIFTSIAHHWMIQDESVIAIGLKQDGSASYINDIILYNIESNDARFLDLFDNSYSVEWNFIELYSNDTSFSIMVSSKLGDILVWSSARNDLLWSKKGASGTRVYHEPILFDIDNDHQLEIVIPGAAATVLNFTTGIKEATIQGGTPQASNWTFNLINVDIDEFMEIYIGYFDIATTQRYYIEILDSPQIIININPDYINNNMVIYSELNATFGFIIQNITLENLPQKIQIFMSNNETMNFSKALFFPYNASIEQETNNPILFSNFKYNNIDTSLYIFFNVTPRWTFSYDGYNDISINLISGFPISDSFSFKQIFRVENDLCISDQIHFFTNELGTIRNDSWIRSDMHINVDNIIIHYEGADDMYPPINSFKLIMIVDSIIFEYSFKSIPPYNLTFNEIPPKDNILLLLKIYIPSINTYCTYQISIYIHVDDHPPILLDIYPQNSTWLCNEFIDFGLTVADNESGLNTEMVQFTVGFNDELDNIWNTIPSKAFIHEGYRYYVITNSSFLEGNNTVFWNITDTVGNFIQYQQYINIDLTKIIFYNFTPTDWTNKSMVDSTIEVSDIGGSGINGSSLQYSFSHSNIFSFSQWFNFTVYPNAPKINVQFVYNGTDGENNIIRFRGKDIAGNEYVSTRLYRIRIDLSPPKIMIQFPEERTIISPYCRQINITIYENGSGIMRLIPLLYDSSTTRQIDLNYTMQILSVDTYFLLITWNDTSSFVLSFHIECYDNKWNIGTNSINEFYVNRPPTFVSILPINGTEFRYRNIINFNVTYLDQDNDICSVIWIIDNKTVILNEQNFSNNSLSVGDHKITVIVRDDFYSIEQQIIITVVRPIVSKTPKYIFYIIVIIFGILITLFLGYRIKMKRSLKI